MKRICLFLTTIIALANCTANCAENDYFEKKTNIENFLIAENTQDLYQNYIIFSKKPVKKIESSDDTIVHAYVMTTIENTRDTIIIEAHSIGNATLKAYVDNQIITIKVTVKKTKTIVETDSELFEIISLDVPSAIKFSEGA